MYDLGSTQVTNVTQTTTYLYRAKMSNASIALSGDTYDIYRQRPNIFSNFAECHELPAKQPGLDDGVDDTGFIVRALLPLTSQNDRENIGRFQGLAKVIDSRVACIRPKLVGTHVCGAWSTSDGEVVYQLCGALYSVTLPDKSWAARPGPGDQDEADTQTFPARTDFRCDIARSRLTRDRHDHDWALCGTAGFTMASILTNSSHFTSYSSGMPPYAVSSLVFNARDVWDQLRDIDNWGWNTVVADNGTWMDLDVRGEGPWAIQRLQWMPPPDTAYEPGALEFQASWCGEAQP